METNELSKNANGGTELMMRRLYSSVAPELLDNFQIIPSRVRDIKSDKIRIYWAHDLPGDPEADQALNNEGWKRFHRLVFVSNWQMQRFIAQYYIPWSRCVVIQNSIEPIERQLPWSINKTEQIRLIYHTTPHRGLNILVAAYQKLSEKYGEAISLDVFSSFKLYGWNDRDEPYREVFDVLEKHPYAAYHGCVSNQDVRQMLAESHIFAYPSIWLETSCLSLIEAMSAGLLCVHPNYGALPETAANWTAMYQMQDDHAQHAAVLYHMLDGTIAELLSGSERLQLQVQNQKAYADVFYNWNTRKGQWENLLASLLNEPRELPREEFVYRPR